jgi:hypothetical protein
MASVADGSITPDRAASSSGMPDPFRGSFFTCAGSIVMDDTRTSQTLMALVTRGELRPVAGFFPSKGNLSNGPGPLPTISWHKNRSVREIGRWRQSAN